MPGCRDSRSTARHCTKRTGCRDNRHPHSRAVRRPRPITADQQLLDDRCPCPAIKDACLSVRVLVQLQFKVDFNHSVGSHCALSVHCRFTCAGICSSFLASNLVSWRHPGILGRSHGCDGPLSATPGRRPAVLASRYILGTPHDTLFCVSFVYCVGSGCD